MRYGERVDDADVVIRRARRVGYRGLVSDVLVGGRSVGLVHLSGTTPPEELAELWMADAIDGANEFLTEDEAVQRTVGQALRNGGLRRRNC